MKFPCTILPHLPFIVLGLAIPVAFPGLAAWLSGTVG